MDVDAIRSLFIQENLRRALMERDQERAAQALRAFRLYYEWYEQRVPDLEKLAILNQFAVLEEAYRAQSSQNEAAGASSQTTGRESQTA